MFLVGTDQMEAGNTSQNMTKKSQINWLIMAGGDLSEATLVSERYLLDLEEKLSCLYVLKEKTLEESNTC
jgi:3-hydroxyacyl-CoA dehydrogenase